ncbi:MAG TPA: LysM peptidoglycan-binding domain-containing protein [Caldithrix sp.]|nr:LysM peptidoglycan-binding domain-containing protein [Caldithrix sp.]
MLRRVIFLFVLLYSYLGFSGELNYSSKELFPVHDEMVDACQFWIKIFGNYNTNQYLIHDSRKLNIVYEVVTWGELDESKADDPFSKEQKVFFKKKTKQYEDLLSGIAAVYPDTNKMDSTQKKLVYKLQDFKNKTDFLEARLRIRVQRGQKNKFQRGLEISGRYMPFLKATFAKHNLPEELIVLPHVESSFNYRAYSSAGAAGIWQFTRGTGKQFLKITYEMDERLDPILATEAAAKLLKRNYEVLGSWPLAITAYNHGAHGMKRAVRKLKTNELNTIIKNYHSRYFKFASRNFYCEFIAALHVTQNYMSYFGPINFEPPLAYKEYKLTQFIEFDTLSDHLKIDKDLFRKYNPALRHPVYDNSKHIPKGYKVKLPVDMEIDSVMAALPASAYASRQKQSKYYKIGYGDNLSNIARRFGTSVETLMALNNISNAHFIRRGMTIRLPVESETQLLVAINREKAEQVKPAQTKPAGQILAARAAETESKPETNTPLELDSPIVVQQADSIPLLTFWLPEPRKDDTTLTVSTAQLVRTTGKTLNDLEIEFIKKSDPAEGYIWVEPEETLGHYADWLQIKTQQIRNWNRISYGTPIQLNQRIKLIFNNISADEFNRLRLEYHRGLEEDFFVNYEITDTLTHQVKNGENLWYICNYIYNLPYWLVVDFNKEVKLDNLKAGDKLIIPAVRSKG